MVSITKYKMSPPDVPSPPDPAVVELKVDSWAAGGRGLGRVEGRVWLVPGTVPGDLVRAAVAHDHGRWVSARLVEIVAPSPRRRVPPCPIQAACGGCPLMAAGEDDQREAKRRFVVDALERIGKLKGIEVAGVVTSPRALGYRNKIELTFGADGSLGYHAAQDPALLVDVPACAIADPRLGAPLLTARESLRDGTLGPRPGRLVLRVSGSTPDVLVGFRDAGEPFDEAPALAARLAAEVPDLRGVVRMIAAAGRRGGTRIETVLGRAWLEEIVLGISFRVPAATFLQVNAGAADALARSVLDEAGEPSSVTELYGGIGAIGLALAGRGAVTTIVDADGDAIACGREAAERSGRAARFVRSDVLRFLRDPGPPPSLVVADPPRTGFGPGVADALAAWAPARIALVSCDPATLARDLARLTRSGYRLDRVAPFDLFPQTAHVEAVAWLTRPR